MFAYRTFLFGLAAAACIAFSPAALAQHGRGGGQFGGSHGGGFSHSGGFHHGGDFHHGHHFFGFYPFYDPFFYGYGYGYPYDYGYGGYGYADYDGYYGRQVYNGRTYAARGSYSAEVDVQMALADRGYYRGRIDGVMGAGTRSAIRAFQRDSGLPVTGHINARLLGALRAG